MLESNAVTQVPMFCPNTIGYACSKVITPVVATAIKRPVVALLLWSIAVITNPTRIPRRGLSKLVISPVNFGFVSNGSIALPIMFIPMNNIPNPIMTSAMLLTFFFLAAR